MDFSFDTFKASVSEGVTTLGRGISEGMSTVGKTVTDALDPSKSRLDIAGLLKGGLKAKQTLETRVGFSIGSPNGNPVPVTEDWRVRVSVGKGSGILYENEPGIMAPLVKTQGVVFPYTPSITTSYSASYTPTRTTHSNYAAYFYEASEVQAIQLSGDFTVQTIEEGQYLLACIYFFRAATKMFYGSSTNAGNPPPVVFLNGYGSHLLPNVPCVVTSFQHVLPNEVDYLEIPSLVKDPTSGGNTNAAAGSPSSGKPDTTRLPVSSQLQISLQPVYSRKSIAEFSLDEFARGKLINKGFL